MMDIMSSHKNETTEKTLNDDSSMSSSPDKSPNSNFLPLMNLDQIFNSTFTQQKNSPSESLCKEGIEKDKKECSFDEGQLELSSNQNSDKGSQYNMISDEPLISFLFKQSDKNNDINNANNIRQEDILIQLNSLRHKNESQLNVPVEQSNTESNLSKNDELNGNAYKNINIITPDEMSSKTIISNCSKQKNQEEEIFNAFAVNVQLQSYFVQMMQDMMTKIGHDNLQQLSRLQQNNTNSQFQSQRDSSNDILKNLQNSSIFSNKNNKKVSLTEEEEPLDLSNKNTSQNSNLCNGSFNNSTNNNVNDNNCIKNSIMNNSLILQEQLIQKGDLTFLPYAFQNQILNKVSTNNVNNRWSSPRGAANRRTYTQTDLEAAVNDIRSGKLGTRRASVVYGIPRSTLRNKIYKLESASANPADILIIGKKKKKNLDEGGKTKDLSNGAPISSTEAEIHLSKLFNTNESVNVATGKLNISSRESDSPKTPTTNIGEILKNNGSVQTQPSVFSMKITQNDNKEKHVLSRENSFNKSYFNEGNNSRNSSENGDCSNLDGLKKSRPKRGQYRKYDKDALDEAVKSVRRGEMSVHRAGSFFGVPHSTLEYKVKERNLLRVKKRQKSFEEYICDDKESPSVEDANNMNLQKETSTNVFKSLSTSWNMISQNSENILTSIATKSSVNK
uniref:HTH psq-type domain-containing protein n=1 Tax=Parastrongyloides trichosuri TaxID=131310 RepID=A0A0N4ZHI6_PARTI